MATIVTINASDLITNSRADLNTNFANLNSDKIETSYLDTDTTLAANSDSKIATQKAVKTYVDAGGNVNASTTNKGIVEEATQAEVDAGTAAGATGARLFVNPSTAGGLADRKKTFTGSATGGAGEAIAGATLPVPVYQNKTDNQWYKCDGNDLTKLKFLGFAVSTAAGDASDITVQFSGIVSGFSGLDEGEKYYLSDTVGTIQTSPGTYEVLVGVAISTTEILIQKGTRRASGTIEFNSTTTSAITVGFRPSRVTISAVVGSAVLNAHSFGSWDVYGGNKCVYASNSPSGSASAGTSANDATKAWKLVNSGGTPYHTGTVTTITDTGFTLDNTEGTDTEQTAIYWEAEGEL